MRQKLLLSGGCRSYSQGGKYNTYLHNACTESINHWLVFTPADQVVNKFKSKNHGSTIQALCVILWLYKHSIKVIDRQQFNTVDLCSSC
jgi:hypothetical protein